MVLFSDCGILPRVILSIGLSTSPFLTALLYVVPEPFRGARRGTVVRPDYSSCGYFSSASHSDSSVLVYTGFQARLVRLHSSTLHGGLRRRGRSRRRLPSSSPGLPPSLSLLGSRVHASADCAFVRQRIILVCDAMTVPLLLKAFAAVVFQYVVVLKDIAAVVFHYVVVFKGVAAMVFHSALFPPPLWVFIQRDSSILEGQHCDEIGTRPSSKLRIPN
ncbi:hypothetical protein Taro_031344 [Colocasia esculenta]|uniref:Uncharacterized protein n=1 Tax=Colocasia esculenta TaxID=4460 RepID=A0A843W0M2_COLES|nr:hypothetical protein [Colocasia esculenta]